MRISGWSSDVCSSDLHVDARRDIVRERAADRGLEAISPVAAELSRPISVQILARIAGDDVDHARGAVAAVERALRTLQQFDAFDVEERKRQKEVGRLVNIVEVQRGRRTAVRAIFVATAETAHRDDLGRARSEEHKSELKNQMSR